jgi:large subunit ribosomal protein L6
MFVKELVIPKDVNIELSGNKVKVKGPKGELEKEFELREDIKIEKVEDKIVVSSESERRKIKALVGTVTAHIRNMIIGVTKGFTYKLKIVYSHFPINVKVEGDRVIIQNFLGERTPRIAKIVGNTEVKATKEEVTVTGINIEDAGQTAANIEQATRIVGFDRKVFTDGIFIIEKPKKRIE